MTNVQKNKNTKNEHSMNPIVAGIAGAVAVGAAVATAVVMSNKKNQKKVKEVLSGAKEKTKKLVDRV